MAKSCFEVRRGALRGTGFLPVTGVTGWKPFIGVTGWKPVPRLNWLRGNFAVPWSLLFLALVAVAEEAPQRHFTRAVPFDIQHTRLELRVELEEERLAGTASHILTPIGRPLHELTLDSVGLDIDTVTTADGTPLSFELGAETLRILLPAPLPPGETLEIRIAYSVTRPERGMHFRTPRLGYDAAELQAWTQGQVEDARAWFPCFDAPNQRASTEVLATVDLPHIALSNGELLAMHEDPEAGTRTFHWGLEQPHPAYLLSLVVGEFVEIRDRAGNVPLYYYVRPGFEDQARRVFARTPDMLRHFEDLLGVAYPYPRYGQITVVDFMVGAMENTTLSTINERILHDAAAAENYDGDWIVAHELAHQWFGNLVSNRAWAHVWLHEGFATYLQLLFTRHDRGEDWFREQLFNNLRMALDAEEAEDSPPVVRKVYAQPRDLFDGRSYAKGAWVLHMLRMKLGDELFFRALNTYLTRHAHGSAETRDFLRICEEISGMGLERFFEQWLHTGGAPALRVAYSWEADAGAARLTVEQTQPIADGALPFRLETDLLFHLPDGPHVERVTIDALKHTFEVPLPAQPEFVRIDPAGDLCKRLDFEKPKAMLLAQLAGDTTLAGQYEAMEQLAAHPGEDVVEALAHALNEAPFWGVRAKAAETLAEIPLDAAAAVVAASVRQEDARARRAVVRALGGIDTPESREALLRACMDPAPYVEASVLESLARLEEPKVIPFAVLALGRKSHNEVVRLAALDVLVKLEMADEQALARIAGLIIAESRPLRHAAMRALAGLARGSEDRGHYRQALLMHGLCEQPNRETRRIALEALVTLGDPEAIPELERYARQAADAEEAQWARDAAAQLKQAEAESGEENTQREEVGAG